MYKVLLVDDEKINYELFRRLVPWEEKGFEISGTAADGLEALQKYEEIRPDLIFLDIQMPSMDGLECAQCIREEDPDVRIVMVSAYGDFSYAQRAIRYGVQDYLLKPVSRLVLNQIVDKIKKTLDERQAEKAVSGEMLAPETAGKKQFYPECGDSDTAAVYSQEELMPGTDTDRLIQEAIRDNSPDKLLEYTDQMFMQAGQKRTDPSVLREASFGLLVQMKILLKRLERQDSFSVMRGIRPEMIYEIPGWEELKNWMEERIRETFVEIDRNFFSQGSRLVLRTNAYAGLYYMNSGFSVQDAADYNGISKNYFTAQYKEQAGIGFWEYVTKLRMERAMELLVTTEDLVSTISSMVGYESEFHFSRKFKEYTGESPAQYRKSHR